jgi:hypothetical protein
MAAALAAAALMVMKTLFRRKLDNCSLSLSLSLSLAPHSPRASIPTRPKCKFPLERPKSTQMQSLSNHRECISWWDNSGWNVILRIRSLAVTLKLKLKYLFLTGEILPKKAILEIQNSKIK